MPSAENDSLKPAGGRLARQVDGALGLLSMSFHWICYLPCCGRGQEFLVRFAAADKALQAPVAPATGMGGP